MNHDVTILADRKELVAPAVNLIRVDRVIDVPTLSVVVFHQSPPFQVVQKKIPSPEPEILSVCSNLNRAFFPPKPQNRRMSSNEPSLTF